MNQNQMETIVKELADNAEGELGFVEFQFSGLTLYLISDTVHDRMRIITPVTDYSRLSSEQLHDIMESNYHKSLDARYAVSDGVLYSAFIHPLSELSEALLESAVIQVANLAATFGEEYSSGVLTYGGNQ